MVVSSQRVPADSCPLDADWATIPTDVLLTELSRRREAGDDTKPQCGSGKRGSYDTTLHVGALVLILVLSTVCTEPTE